MTFKRKASEICDILYTRMESWEEVYLYTREVYRAVMHKIAQLLTLNGIAITGLIYLISNESNGFLMRNILMLSSILIFLSLLSNIYCMWFRYDNPITNHGDPQKDSNFIMMWICKYGAYLNISLSFTGVGFFCVVMAQLYTYLSR